MEAIVVFSLACGVLQVIDVAGKVTSIILKIYKDSNSLDEEEAETLSKRLAGLATVINGPLTSHQHVSAGTQAENEVRQAAVECSAVAQELQLELQKLKEKGRKRGLPWKGLKIARKRAEIQKIQEKLSRSQRLFETTILVRLREQYNVSAVAQHDGFEQLDATLQRFITDLSNNQDKVMHKIEEGYRATQHLITSGNASTSMEINQGLERLRLQTSTRAERERLVQSLRFDEIFSRLNSVSDASFGTYNWIFEDNLHVEDRMWPSFTDWLKHGDNLYWIQGKAGSGKSTFTKFILEDQRTRACLGARRIQAKVQLISHFFWLSGSNHQKNLHGLLCSLLYQMLEEDDELVDQLLKVSPGLRKKRCLLDWNVKELHTNILELLRTNSLRTTYLISLDGLDEFGEHDAFGVLLDLIFEIAPLSNVRLCISSRPEPAILRVFKNIQPLRLQDLTQQDIQAYAESEMNRLLKLLTVTIDSNHEWRLVREITSKAEGVFLWVRLAINDIRRGLAAEDTFDELLSRISRLPRTIEELYQNMLDRLGDDWEIYRQEAAFYLKMCYWATDIKGFDCHGRVDDIACCKLSTLTMSLGLQQFQTRSTIQVQHATNISKTIAQCKRLSSRLLSCCAGMIETSTETYPHDVVEAMKAYGPSFGLARYNCQRISFSHRTVRDFLETPGGARILARCPASESCLYIGSIQASCLLIQASCVKLSRFQTAIECQMSLTESFQVKPYTCSEMAIVGMRITRQALRQRAAPMETKQTATLLHSLECQLLSQEIGDFRAARDFGLNGLWVQHGIWQAIPRVHGARGPVKCPTHLQLTPAYATYLLGSAAPHSRTGDFPLVSLLEAGADLNKEIAMSTNNRFLSTPWLSILASNPPALAVKTCLSQGASLDAVAFVRYDMEFQPRDARRTSNQKFTFENPLYGLDLDLVTLSPLDIMVFLATNAWFVLNDIVLPTFSDSSGLDEILASKEHDVILRPSLMIFKNVKDEYREISPSDSRLVLSLIRKDQTSEGDSAYIRELYTSMMAIFDRSTPTRYLAWASREGIWVSEDHPAIPKEPFERLSNCTDEEYEEYERVEQEQWEKSQWMIKPEFRD